MNNFFVMLGLLIGSSAMAATHTYDLNMELSINGKKVSSPHIIVAEGETASIEQGNPDGTIFIEVIAHEASQNRDQGIASAPPLVYWIKTARRPRWQVPGLLRSKMNQHKLKLVATVKRSYSQLS